MKTINKTYNVYNFSELSEDAKEKIKNWYLEDPIRNDLFYEDIIDFLKTEFPRSHLNVVYSLGYCQGDGLNIIGDVNLIDFLKKWEATEKEKKAMEFYINKSLYEYSFSRDYHCCYSCKFLDEKNIDYQITEFIENLENINVSNIKKELIKKFYNDLISYFSELDEQIEKDGYRYFYEVEDEEVEEFCAMNNYYFDANGKLEVI